MGDEAKGSMSGYIMLLNGVNWRCLTSARLKLPCLFKNMY